MNSPFDDAWGFLKSAPVGPSGQPYGPAELQQLRAFVHQNLNSADPEKRARAEELRQQITAGVSGSGGRSEMGPYAPSPQPTPPQAPIDSAMESMRPTPEMTQDARAPVPWDAERMAQQRHQNQRRMIGE